MEKNRRIIGEISYFKSKMKIINDSFLLNKYLTSAPYTNYFRENIHAYTQILEYEAGEVIIRQDTPPSSLYLMVAGRCCVRVLLANGKSIILRTLKAPCLIGEMELIQDVSSFTVQALEKSRMLAISLRECKSNLLGDTYFLRRLCSDLILKERVEAFTLLHSFAYPLENRLARFILDNRQEKYFYVKKVLIAESLGVSYRHVGKVMNDFINEKYLSKEGLVYTITNEEALTALAQELDVAELIDFN